MWVEHQDVWQGNEFKEKAIQLNKLMKALPVKWGILGSKMLRIMSKGKSFIEISYSRLDNKQTLAKKEEKKIILQKIKTALLKDCIIF